MKRLILAILLVLLVAPIAQARLSVGDVAEELRCPTCDTPLEVSNAPVAQDMKALIAKRISQGWSKDRIVREMVDQFGPAVLTTPPKSGFDLVAWLVPGLAVLAGLAALPFVARAWSRRRASAGGEPALATPTPDEARRLDDELRRLGD